MSIPIPTPNEFNEKRRVSFGLMAYLFAAGLFIGFGVCAFWFALAEVDGVRKDMNKEDEALRERIDAVNKRIDRKINNHEAIWHQKAR